MTTAIAAAHPKLTRSELPEELWQDILRMACGGPPIEDKPKLLSFPVHRFSDREFFRKRMRFQRFIILVCKTWHRIALPCFVEQIAILDQSRPEVEGLADMLEKYSLGRFVKRLDLHLWQPFGQNDPDIRDVFKHLSNLRVLTVRMCKVGDSLEINGPLADEYYINLLEIIFALPNLQVLDFPWNRYWPLFYEMCGIPRPISFIRSPSLRSSWITAPLPTLTQVMAVPSSHTIFYTKGFMNEITVENVTSIIFDLTEDWGKSYVDICQSLPCLQYVTIYVQSVDVFNRYPGQLEPPTAIHPNSVLLPPSVHTLGLWFRQPKAKSRIWQKFCQTLDLIVGEGLKIIRFRTETMESICHRHTVYDAINKTIRAKGWRMESGDIDV